MFGPSGYFTMKINPSLAKPSLKLTPDNSLNNSVFDA